MSISQPEIVEDMIVNMKIQQEKSNWFATYGIKEDDDTDLNDISITIKCFNNDLLCIHNNFVYYQHNDMNYNYTKKSACESIPETKLHVDLRGIVDKISYYNNSLFEELPKSLQYKYVKTQFKLTKENICEKEEYKNFFNYETDMRIVCSVYNKFDKDKYIYEEDRHDTDVMYIYLHRSITNELLPYVMYKYRFTEMEMNKEFFLYETNEFDIFMPPKQYGDITYDNENGLVLVESDHLRDISLVFDKDRNLLGYEDKPFLGWFIESKLIF